MRARERGKPGFTLIEVLVAAGLVSVVLGLALKGFTEAKKIADITKSKVIAEEEAALGAQKLAKIVKRLHAIYFDARPLARQTTDITTLGQLASVRTAAPPAWLTGGAITGLTVPKVFLGATTSGLHQVPIRDGWSGAGVDRSTFFLRHLDDSVNGTEDGPLSAPGQRLRTGDNTGAKNFDRFFTSPLLYGGEATFDNAAPATGAVANAGSRVEANLPVTWTFYLVYLAPMRFDKATEDGHALFPVQDGSLNGRRDRGPEGWVRSTVPYELRLLTIPDVVAVDIGSNGGSEAAPNPTAASLPNRVGYHNGRRLDVVSVLPFPYDVLNLEANYDPLPMPMTADTFVQMTTNSTHYGAACGPRVKSPANNAVHGNFNNIGNDPPTQAALSTRRHWDATTRTFTNAVEPITDTLLARYVDPDAVHGTFVRLANDWNYENETETQPRPYINAYGGPIRYNPLWWNADNTAANTPPTRALVSVATRFRLSRQHPFAFSTESVEVDLETLTRFQTMDYRKRR